MRKAIILLLLLIFGGTCIACSSGCGSKSTININYNLMPPSETESTVEILKDYNVIVHEERTPVCGGTVIFSDKNVAQVLTAAHCIMNKKQIPMSYGLIDLGHGEFYRVRIVKFSRQKDLALLETTDKLEPQKVAPIAKLIPAFGDTIWAIGYGARSPDALSKGIVSKVHALGRRLTHVMQLDVTGWHGSSGGGIFNENFELVGVCIEFGPQGGSKTGWMFATHLEEIIDFLTGD